MRIAGVAAVCWAVLASAGPAAGAAARGSDWTRFGVDPARSNVYRAPTGIRARDLAHLVRQDLTVPGTVDSSPLYLHDALIAGQTRDAFLASTTYGLAFALDADTGETLWTYTPPAYPNLVGTYQFQSSSPVVDPRRGVMYATSPDGLIHKLRVADGQEVLTGSWPRSITYDASHEKMSSSLNLFGRYVMATTAGYGDHPPYVGHIALVDRRTGSLDHVFNTICPRSHRLILASTCKQGQNGGIWGRSGAIVIPGSHRLVVTVGNSKWNGRTNYGDTVIELSPDATRVLDTWTPRNQSAMNAFDLDLGATEPAIVRSPRGLFGVQGGKDGLLRLLDLNDLSGNGGHPCACLTDALRTYHPKAGGIFTTPAIWHHDGRIWVFLTTYGSTLAYTFTNAARPKLHHEWRYKVGGSSPVVAGGLLYVFDPLGGKGLSVYRPETGKLLARLPVAAGHWNSPIVAGGRIAVPTGSVNDKASSGNLTIFRKP